MSRIRRAARTVVPAMSIAAGALFALLLPANLAHAEELACGGLNPGANYTGAPQDYTIPTVDTPAQISLQVKGGDGGNTRVEACDTLGCQDVCDATGGRGAEVFATFPVGSGAHELQPGGTLRFIVGDRGQYDLTTVFYVLGLAGGNAYGGGGGGSAVLYRPPGVAGNQCSEWELLVVAGGGGGAHSRMSAIVGCDRLDDGGAGQTTIDGAQGGGGGGAGGVSGGNGVCSGGGSGGGFNASEAGSVGPGACFEGGDPTCYLGGGNGISTTFGGVAGAWGFGGGGASGTGAGGGGGYSGGGGGDRGVGGGGGSYVSPWATYSRAQVASRFGQGFVSFSCDCSSGVPANDECGAAAPLSEGVNVGCTDSATTSADPYTCGLPIVEDVWHSYTNDDSCPVEVQFDWCNNDYLEELGFYFNCGEQQAACGSNGGGCTASAVLQPAATALLRLGGRPGAIVPSSGSYQINVTSQRSGADTDGDGTPDACDPCPLDAPDDTDGDGVCDSDDLCPGFSSDTCTSATGFTCPYTLDNWFVSNPENGFALTTPETGESDLATFTYATGVEGSGPVPFRNAVFETLIEAGGLWTFDYRFSGVHGGVGARAYFRVAVLGPDGQTDYVVRDRDVNGSFEFSGTLSITVNTGYRVAILAGGNTGGTEAFMSGSVQLSNVEFPSLPDLDRDGVPNTCDVCGDGDDNLDTDGDGTADACDACPDDATGDSDGDGVCDSDDVCAGGDDAADADGDGAADACDACPGFDDGADADGDGFADGCDVCPGFDDIRDADADGTPDGCDVEPMNLVPCAFTELGGQGQVVQDLDIPVIEVPFGESNRLLVDLYGGAGGTATAGGGACTAEGGLGARLRLGIDIGVGPGEISPGGTLRWVMGERGATGLSPSSFATAGGGGSSALYYRPPGGDWAVDGVLLAVAGGGGGGVAEENLFGGCSPRDGNAAAEVLCTASAAGDCSGAGGAGGLIDPLDPGLGFASGGGAGVASVGGGGSLGGQNAVRDGAFGGQGVGSAGGWGLGGGGAGHFGGGGGGGGYTGGAGGTLAGGSGGTSYMNPTYVVGDVVLASEISDGYSSYRMLTGLRAVNDEPDGDCGYPGLPGCPLVNGLGEITIGLSPIEVTSDTEYFGSTCNASDTNQNAGPSFIVPPPRPNPAVDEYGRYYDIPSGPYKDVWYVLRPPDGGGYTLTIWTDDPAEGTADNLAASVFFPTADVCFGCAIDTAAASAGRRGAGSFSFSTNGPGGIPSLLRVTQRNGAAFRFRFDRTTAANNPSETCATAPEANEGRRSYTNQGWVRFAAPCDGTVTARSARARGPRIEAYDGCGGPLLAVDAATPPTPSATTFDSDAEVSVPVTAGQVVYFQAQAFLQVEQFPFSVFLNPGPVDLDLTFSAPDTDGDGFADGCDTCDTVADPDQSDSDGDGLGDLCDPCSGGLVTDDADGDGVCDADDTCPGQADGVDSDGDGVADGCDVCPLAAPDDSDDDGTCGTALTASTIVVGTPRAQVLDRALTARSCPTFNDPSTFDFYVVDATAGSTLDIEVDRRNYLYNPYVSVWPGDLRGTPREDFTSASTHRSLTAVGATGNGVSPATTAGDGQDPRLSVSVPTTGRYTVLVAGECDSRGGNYPYEIRVSEGSSPTVTNVTQGTTHPTIQDAFNNALSGDVIELGAGRFFESQMYVDAATHSSLTLRGQGSGRTIIDGGGPPPGGTTFYTLAIGSFDGLPLSFTLEGVTIDNSWDNQGFGAGFVNFGVSATLRDVRFLNSEGRDGAIAHSLFWGATDSIIEDSYFGDFVGSPGFAAFDCVGTLTVRNTVFSGGTTGDGTPAPTLTVTGAALEFVNNTVLGDATFGNGSGPPINITNSVLTGTATLGAEATARYSVFAGAPVGSGNINATPIVVDAANGDARLAPTSRGIDAADYAAWTAAGGGAFDALGNARIVDVPTVSDTGTGAIGYLDMGALEAFPDADGDGVADSLDVCPGANDRQDSDGDGLPDACDPCDSSAPDGDGDGVCDLLDACPGADDRADADVDGVPDGCDICAFGPDGEDFDGDGTPDLCDGCPLDPSLLAGTPWWEDRDGDGFGGVLQTIACAQPFGYVANDDDCDDDAASVNPDATESCSGVDDDCDGAVDEDAGTVWYRDIDGDGFGDGTSFQRACSAPGGHVAAGTDCDDMTDLTYPGAPEVCDAVDNDCSGAPDAGTCPAGRVCVPDADAFTCACGPGTRLEAGSCVDIDECAEGTDLCTQGCLNLSGAYACTCETGYQLGPDGFTCLDQNECVENPCDPAAACVNTPGSFECVCNGGFTGDGFLCFDIDECLDPDTCGLNELCNNLQGSFECFCDVGYALNLAAECVDVDECAAGTSSCDQVCTNTEGSFECGCVDGFAFDETGVCADVDECAGGTDLCDQTCENVEGSYACDCGPGYELAPDGVTCLDVDECGEGTSFCDQVCTNTEGSFECSCFSGYAFNDAGVCADIDECAAGDVCAPEAVCTNLDGSFDCACPPGFAGDGFTCTAVSDDCPGKCPDGLPCLLGTDDDDIIIGTAAAECIVAYDGDDYVEGGGGEDWIFGGNGDDILIGGAQADTIRGENDIDELIGDAGADDLRGGNGNDFIDAGPGEDYARGGNGDDLIVGSDDDEDLRGDGGDDIIDAGGGNDLVIGSSGNDVLIGGLGDDDLRGGGDDDELRGGAGVDRVNGGGGNDTLYGGSENDLLIGGSGEDSLFGEEGDDNLKGGTDIDFCDGGDGDDRIRPGGGAYDRAFGGSGNDNLIDNDGALGMHGGPGDDLIRVKFAAGWVDTNGNARFDGKFSGGTGDDTARITINEGGPALFINSNGDEASGPTSEDGAADRIDIRGPFNPGSIFPSWEDVRLP